MWSVTFSPEAQPTLAAAETLTTRTLGTADLVRPAPDLNGDGIGDLVWGWQGSLRTDHPPRTLLAMSGKTGEVLWMFTGRYFREAAPSAAQVETEVRLMGMPLVRDMDADGTPDLLQPFASQGFVRHSRTERLPSGNASPDGPIGAVVPQQWTWIDIVSGRTGQWIRRFDGGVSSKQLPRGEPGFQSVLTATKINGQDFIAEATNSLVRGIPVDSTSYPAGRMLENKVVGTPRFAELDGPAVLILQQTGLGEPATLSALAIPGGETKWECPQVWPWTIRPNAVEQTAPAEWPLVEDLDGDGRLEIVVPWVERMRGRDPHQLEIQALDGASGQASWRYPMGEPLSWIAQPRLVIGPDVDGDACREVFVAGLFRDPGSRVGGSCLVVAAVSGKNGLACWRWQQAGQFEPLRASIDPLQWWQPGSDGRPQLLVACHGGGPPGSEADRMIALTAGTGRLAHKLHYPGAVRLETADLDRDGILDLVVHPDLSRGEGTLARCAASRRSRGGGWNIACRLKISMETVWSRFCALGDVQTTCFSGRDSQRLWEVQVGGHPQSYPLPDGDLDGDGTADVLCVSGGGQFEPLNAISGKTGAMRWVSSLKIARSEFFNTLRLEPSDLDGDRRPEVICVFEREVHTTDAGNQQRQRWLAVLSGQNGQVRWQEPLTAPTLWNKLPAVYAFRPAIGDLDRDGIRDIAVWMATPKMEYHLRTFRGSDGKSLWSRPLPILAAKPDRHILDPDRLVAAICDLHGDGQPRVLVEFESSDDGYTPARTEVWALNGADGAVEWQWRGPPKQANAADLSDPTPLTLRLHDHRNVAVLTATTERDARAELLSVLDARGQTVATAVMEAPDRRGGYSTKLHVVDVDGDGQDELFWIGDGKLHASSGDLAAVRWQWNLPTGRGELVDLPTTATREPPAVAVWSGDAVYGLEAATGRLRWRCEGPGPPARQLAVHVLGFPRADGLPLIAFHEMYDPDNYANVSTVCRQALPPNTVSVRSREE